ncbi:hypothetical protein [Pendulispora albinea]|uniref:Uncharacterized protein n=1 Tax=Pendulispora albinea TaxID=2741071 RepID=A0ABZ2M0D3_9BACT
MKRLSDIFWRFRFSIFFTILYAVAEWGFAQVSFKEGFFTAGSPNLGVFLVGAMAFLLRLGVLFLVPAHLAYRVVELVVSLVLSAKLRAAARQPRE